MKCKNCQKTVHYSKWMKGTGLCVSCYNDNEVITQVIQAKLAKHDSKAESEIGPKLVSAAVGTVKPCAPDDPNRIRDVKIIPFTPEGNKIIEVENPNSDLDAQKDYYEGKEEDAIKEGLELVKAMDEEVENLPPEVEIPIDDDPIIPQVSKKKWYQFWKR